MRILVTGGRGFLGSHVVPALQHAGHEVRSLARSDGPAPSGVERFRADLATGSNLAAAFDGVSALVHLAATLQGSDDQILRDTVDGTNRLLQAMEGSECRRIVLVSSFSVYDWSRVTRTIHPDSPILREDELEEQDGYARAKWLQERLVRNSARLHGWTLTILRPSVIRSESVDGGFLVGPRVGPIQVVVAPRAMIRLVHVDTVVRAIVSSVGRSSAGEEVRILIDPPTWTTWQYARRLGGFRIPLPYGFGMLVAKMASFVARGSTRLPYLLQPARFESLHKPVEWTTAAEESQ